MIKCQVGGVDVSAYLKNLTTSPGGDGIVGDATLILDQQAGGLDLRTFMDVKVFQTFDSSGNGIAAKGRLFGGHVATRDTGNVGTTKLWALKCWDYNIILHRLVRDASTAKAITLTAGTFAAQILQLTDVIQKNGNPSVNTTIDATSGVASLYPTMPAVTYPGGHPYGWYIQQLCNTAQSLNSALIPHFYMGVAATFGIADTFGTPVLYVYDGASLPAIGLSFSDVVAGGRKGIFGAFRRVDDATATVQRRQAFFSDAHVIVTSADATSQATYPNPYINHGGASNTGYWMDEVIEDRDSTTFAEAQAALDRRNSAQSNPVETFEFETEERVLPGDMVGLGYALESIPDDTPYRVAKVSMTIEPPEVINSRLTLNSRRLGLFDDGTAVFAPPVEGDPIPPLPPTAFSVTQNYYDPDTGDANIHFSIGASPSPDVVGYKITGLVGHAYISQDVQANLTPALTYPSGLAYSLQAVAYDRAGNISEGYPTSPITGTTAVPTYDTVPNSDFDVFDRLDTTLHRNWSRIAVAGGTAVYNTASNTGPACVLLTTTGSLGSAISYQSSLTVAKGTTYAEVFWAKANSGTPSLTVTYKWYDNTQAYLSGQDTTFVKTLSTSWARYTGTMTKPSAGAFFRVMYSIVSLSTIVRVDTTSHEPQTPNDGIEDGAITVDKTNLAPLLADPLYIYDENGDAVYQMYWSISAHTFTIVPVGSNPTYTDQGLFFQDNSGAVLRLQNSLLQWGGGIETTLSTKTSTFTADATRFAYLCNTTGGNFTANLPQASACGGRVYAIVNTAKNVLSVDGYQQDTIAGAYIKRMSTKWQAIFIQSDGVSNWNVLAEAVGAAEWRPTTPSNLKLWTPTDVVSGNDGDAIGTLADQSGNSFDLTQATGSLKPLLKTGANGQNGGKVLLFDGTDDYLARTGLTALNSIGSFTILLVFKTADAAGNHGLLWKGGDGKFVQIFSSNLYVGDGNTGYGHFSFTDTTNYHVLSIEFDGSLSGDANRLKAWLDGTSKTITFDAGIGTTTNATNGLWLGSNHSLAVFHQGQIADMAIWSAKLSSTDRGIAEQFFKDKWGTP